MNDRVYAVLVPVDLAQDLELHLEREEGLLRAQETRYAGLSAEAPDHYRPHLEATRLALGVCCRDRARLQALLEPVLAVRPDKDA